MGEAPQNLLTLGGAVTSMFIRIYRRPLVSWRSMELWHVAIHRSKKQYHHVYIMGNKYGEIKNNW